MRDFGSINLFTRYDFTSGFLKNFTIGGGINHRGEAYLAVVNGEFYFSPSTLVVNGLPGCRATFGDRPVGFRLDINNLTDNLTNVSHDCNSAQ